jgi:hypothetical protein
VIPLATAPYFLAVRTTKRPQAQLIPEKALAGVIISLSRIESN